MANSINGAGASVGFAGSIGGTAPRNAAWRRHALLGSSALIGFVLTASPATAQSFPVGGGTIVVDGGGTTTNNTGANGGFENTDGSSLTITDATINNTTGSPTPDAIRFTRTTFSGFGDGAQFVGTNTLVAAPGGSGFNFSSTGGNNTGVGFNGTLNVTGLNGVVVNSAGAIFHGGAATFNLTAQTNGSGSGLLWTSANSCICDTSLTGAFNASGFQFGANLNAANGVNFTTGSGGSIVGVEQGIRANATAGNVDLIIGSSINGTNVGINATAGMGTANVTATAAIVAPTGISGLGATGVNITTSGSGTINSTATGTGTGISASSTNGNVVVNVGAAIGGTTRPSVGVNASTTGTGTVAISTTAAITANTGIIASSGATSGNTIDIGAFLNVATFSGGVAGVLVQSSGFTTTIARNVSVQGPTVSATPTIAAIVNVGNNAVVNNGTISGAFGVTFQNGGSYFGAGRSTPQANDFSRIISSGGTAIDLVGGVAGGPANSIVHNGLIFGRIHVNSAADTTLSILGTLFGNIEVEGSGTRTTTINTSMTGNYTDTGGNGIDLVTIGSSATFQGDVSLGGGDDVVTYSSRTLTSTANQNLGAGQYDNLFDGGAGNDVFNVAAAFPISIELGNLTNFETYTLQSGNLTLTGSRTGGAGWNLAGGTLTLSGSLTTSATAINASAGTQFYVTSTGVLDTQGHGGVAIAANAAGAFGINNAGFIGNGTIGGNTIQAVNPGVVLTLINSGTITTPQFVAVLAGTGSTINNSGTITGGADATFGIAVELNGAGTVTNTGLIQGAGNAGIQLTTGNSTINNNTGGAITGASGIRTLSDAVLTLTNNGIVAGTANAINAAGTGIVTITNNVGGTIGTGTVTGGVFTAGGTGHAIVLANSGTVTNAGTISSAAAVINQTSATGTLNLVNTGTIQQVNYAGVDPADAIVASGVATILNSGTISSANFYGVVMNRGGVLTNAAGGSIMAGNAGGRYGVFNNGAAGTSATINNYGTISGTDGLGILGSGTPNTINLHAGSTTGSIQTGSGNDTLALFNGRGTASAATVDAPSGITLQNAGTLAGATVGSIDLGGGTNTLALRGIGDGTAANGAVGTLSVSSIAGLSVLNKLDSGTWNITSGTFNYTGGTNVLGGRLVFVNRTAPAGTATISSGATLEFNLASGTFFQDAATFNGAGTFTKSGNAVLANRGLISLASGGLIDVQGGTLVGSSDGLGLFTGNLASLNVASGAMFVTSEASVIVDRLTGTGTVGTDVSGNFTVGVDNGSATFGGNIVNQNGTPGGKLVKVGTGVQTLTGANIYTGATTISGGTLALGGTSTLGNSAITNNATFDIAGHTGGLSVLNLLGSGATTLGANTLTITNASGAYSGAFTGTGGLTKQGTGTYILSGAGNSYSGTTTVSGGTLQGSTESFSSLSTIVNNATFAFVQAASGTFVPTISGTGVVTVSGLTAGNMLTFGGALSNSSGLTISGTSSVTINAGAAGGILENGAGNRTLTIAGGSANNTTGNTFGSGLFVQTSSGTTTVNVAAGASLSTTAGSGNRDGITALSTTAIINNGTISSSFNAGIALAGGGSINNSGMITGGTGGNGFGIAVSNGSAATVTLQSTSVVSGTQGGIAFQSTGTGANSAQLSNAGQVTSTRFGIESVGSGTPMVTNLAGGQIVGGLGGIFGSTLTITNSGTIGVGSIVSGVFVQGSSSGAGIGAAISFSNGGTVSNLAGGSIIGSSDTVFGTSRQAGIAQDTGSLIVDNSGAIAGGVWGITADTGGVNITNLSTGIITGTTNNAIYAGQSANSVITNIGTLEGGNAGIFSDGVGLSITNSGVIRQVGAPNSANNTVSSAIYVSAANAQIINSGMIVSTLSGGRGIFLAGSGGTITNQSGGTISGSGSGDAILLSGVNYSVILNSGSTTNGAINASATSGTNSYTLAGTLNGGLTGGSGNDTVTFDTTGGSVSGNLMGGGGVDALIATGTGSSTLAGAITDFESLTKNGTGTLTLTGTNTGLDTIVINAGALSVASAANLGATGSIGLLGGTLVTTGSFTTDRTVFTNMMAPGAGIDVASGTTFGVNGLLSGDGALSKSGLGTLDLLAANTGFSGDLFVNGGAVRAGNINAFGTGTIHLVDPTLIYGVTGTYANNILLEVQTPASADPSTLRAESGVTATISGSITQGTGAGVDPNQPLVIDGLGQIILTNSANAWAGTTTINVGATLQGTSSTISGSNVVANGLLLFSQPISGTFAQNVSGNGNVQVTGLGAGQTFTIGGALTNASGLQVRDGSALALTGSVATTGSFTAVTLNLNNIAGVTSQLNNSGSISGVFALFARTNLDLINSGSIAASVANFNSSGIFAGGNATIVNSGQITSGTNALFAQATGSLTNSGLIRGGINASTIRFVGTNSSLNNLASGVITTTGTGAGIFFDGANASVVNAGSITGGNAVQLVAGGMVTNTGTLTSTVGSGVVFNATGSVDNQASGVIQGATNGVIFAAGTATITNAGSITGSNGWGLRLLGGGTVTNSATGLITGTGNAAVLAQGGALSLVNAGSLTGTTGVAVVTSGGFNNLIDLRAGSTTNGSVTTDTGADMLTLGLGATVIGALDGGAGIDGFVVDGAGSTTLAGNVLNFESLTKNGAGTLTLSGSNAGFASVAVNAGTLNVNNGAAIDDLAAVTVASGATFGVLSDETIGTLVLGGTLAGTGTLTATEYQLTGATVNANLGTGNLFQLGGTSVLNGTAAAANVMVQGGTLTLGASNRLADAANVAVSTGATLNLGGTLDTVGIVQLGGTLGGTGTLSAAQYQLTAATVNANLGAGTLFQLGGTSTLNGSSAASTVMINTGTLALGGNERLADTAFVQLASGSTLSLAGRTETIGGFGGMGTIALGNGRLVAGGTNADFGFGGNITGSGDLDKIGNGTFTLAGNLAQIGRLNLNAGTTMFVGSTAGSVRVQGGTLTGSAAIAGNLTIALGSFSPGTTAQPIAAFTAGSFNASGGTLTFDLGGPATGFAADMISVSGAAVLTGGTVFTRPIEATANYRVSQNYVLLRSASLTGMFANGSTFTPTGTNPDLQWRLRYDLLPNAVVLELRKQIDFTSDLGPSASGNERLIGGALNGGAFMASDNWANILNIISSQDPATRRETFNSISGEAISDITSATMIASSGFTDLLRQRLATGGGASGNANLLSGLVGGKQALVALVASAPLDGAALPGNYADSAGNDDEKRAGVWLQGFGANGRIDGLAGQARVDTFSAGVAGGIDARFGNVTVGGAFAASQVETKVRARTSTNQGTLYQGGGYVAYDNGQLYGSVVGSYFTGDIDSRRSVFVGGALVGLASGTATTRGYSAGAALGYRLPLSQSVLFTPQVSFTANGVTRGAFTETGVGGLSLQASRERRQLYAATAEGRLSRVFDALGGTVEPYIGGGAVYSFGDLDTFSTNRFSGAPVGTGTFTIEGARLAPVTALVTGGLDVRPTNNVRLGLQGEARLSQRQREERISLNLRIGF